MEGFQSPYSMPQANSKTKFDEKIDYSNLPCPVPYEELYREATMALKPELFEGFRFDYTKMLNQKFGISHSVSMGPTEIPPELFKSPSSEIIKIPTANYDFCTHYVDPKLLLVGRVTTDGRLNARLKYDFTDNLSIKSNAQGSDYRTQLQLGTGSLVIANYIQHVTPKLSLGGEVFWAGEQMKSGVGLGARYENDKMVATGQIASSGVAMMNYVHKVSEKVSFAADFMYNHAFKDVTASVGYDYILRQCRIRGKIDSNGVVAAHLEERLTPALGILISAEVDHRKKDYKFGIGLSLNP
ncbi:unnamed protein product [Arabis nemorensis]|uniref:Uncharacterized protein n=1 Tax=Arabis nemorensis TaxID=586526 RepID=A0A565BGB6_9BRAS|nr:unnamed protein product [Arabis nemorensis]